MASRRLRPRFIARRDSRRGAFARISFARRSRRRDSHSSGVNGFSNGVVISYGTLDHALYILAGTSRALDLAYPSCWVRPLPASRRSSGLDVADSFGTRSCSSPAVVHPAAVVRAAYLHGHRGTPIFGRTVSRLPGGEGVTNPARGWLCKNGHAGHGQARWVRVRVERLSVIAHAWCVTSGGGGVKGNLGRCAPIGRIR